MCQNYDGGPCEEPGCTGQVTCHDFTKRCWEHDVNGKASNAFLDDDPPDWEDELQPVIDENMKDPAFAYAFGRADGFHEALRLPL